ncbi:hypothetical protein IL306_014017 [Fusarium sp. DS 682]|nr:hypothetical protein IL306_014017 [Fusarium sp. DS 682]
MKFSAFFVIASAAFATAAPGVFTFSQERAALNESAPSPGREDGRADLREPEREEGREEDRDGQKGDRDEDRKDRDGRGGKDGRLQRGGLAFNQVDLNYLLRVNQLNVAKLQILQQRNNFNIAVFSDLFASRDFSLKSLLEFQQLSTMLAIAETGIFDQFELSRLDLGALNLGLIDGIASLNLAQFIDAALKPKITVISKEVNNNIIIAKTKDHQERFESTNDKQDEEDLRNTKAQIAALEAEKQKKIAFFDQDKQVVGRVFLASGFRRNGVRRMDWALITVDEPRQWSNNLPTETV